LEEVRNPVQTLFDRALNVEKMRFIQRVVASSVRRDTNAIHADMRLMKKR